MPASASRSSSCPAALPCWVKELLTLVPETSTCVVSVSRGQFVVKVRTTDKKWLKPHQPQGADHPPQRVPRGEDQLPGTCNKNARKRRSDERARRHAAKRHCSLLRLQGLLHRHLWQRRGWQRMQDVWTAWSRKTALPPPAPAPPLTRPLQIVDPRAFPALPTAPASIGLRKREVSGSPPPASPTTALVSLGQPSSPWTRVMKPRQLRGFYPPTNPTAIPDGPQRDGRRQQGVIPGRPYGLDWVATVLPKMDNTVLAKY